MAKFGKLGGSHSMHSGRGVATQKPGVASQEGSGRLGGGVAVQAGPSSAGFYSEAATNKDYAGTQSPGTSSPTKSGGNAKWATGGNHSMFGPGSSKAARGGSTSSN